MHWTYKVLSNYIHVYMHSQFQNGLIIPSSSPRWMRWLSHSYIVYVCPCSSTLVAILLGKEVRGREGEGLSTIRVIITQTFSV